MALPRVFISSTFFDLRQIRADLVRFVREMGYESITNERGNIPYGSEEKLEEYCYKEIELADVLVAVIGGRFGSTSAQSQYSISNIELKTALELGKQVYIFVEGSVDSEYYTYLENLGNEDIEVEKIRYRFVDDIRVFHFLKEIHALPHNNTIATFRESQDIVDYLRQQWAGLFQRFLQQATLLKEIERIKEIQSTTRTLQQLVTYLVEEKTKGEEAIQEILTINHPAFQQIASLLGVGYRVMFTNRSEMESWLKVRGFVLTPEHEWDEPEYEEWRNESKLTFNFLRIKQDLFRDDGRLKIFTSDQWNREWIAYKSYPKMKAQLAYPDDDFDDSPPPSDVPPAPPVGSAAPTRTSIASSTGPRPAAPRPAAPPPAPNASPQRRK